MEESRPKRRMIVAEKPKANIITLSSIDTLIEDALSVIEKEIVKFRSKTNVGRSLDLKEARVLQGYIKALVELSREHRERSKNEDFSGMTDEELLAYMQDLVSKRKQVVGGRSSESGGT